MNSDNYLIKAGGKHKAGVIPKLPVFPELPGFEVCTKEELKIYIRNYLSFLQSKIERGSDLWLRLESLRGEELIGRKWTWNQRSNQKYQV